MLINRSRPKPVLTMTLGRIAYSAGLLGQTIFNQKSDLKTIPKGYRAQCFLEFFGNVTVGSGGAIASVSDLAGLLATYNGTIPGVQRFKTALTGFQWLYLLKSMGAVGEYPYDFNVLKTQASALAIDAVVPVCLQWPLHIVDPFGTGYEQTGLYGDQMNCESMTIGLPATLASVDANLAGLSGFFSIQAYLYKATRCIQHPEVYVQQLAVNTAGRDFIVSGQNANDPAPKLLRYLAQHDAGGGIVGTNADQLFIDGKNQFDADYGETIATREIRMRRFYNEAIDENTPTAVVNLEGLNDNEATSMPILPTTILRYIDNRAPVGQSMYPRENARIVPAVDRTGIFEVSYLHTTQAWANECAASAGIQGVPLPTELGLLPSQTNRWQDGQASYPCDLGLLPQ